MKTPQQKIVVIYHGGCPDGFGGAYAAWKKFGNKAAYLPARDRFAPPCPLKNKEVYLIDYTYQEGVVKKLIKDNRRVTAIDHHGTGEAAVALTKDPLFSLKHSGAVLAWHYFHPDKKMPSLLKYIEDRDLWNWKLPSSREILKYVDLMGQDFATWDRIVKDLDTPSKKKIYKEKGALLLRYEQSIVDSILPAAELVRFQGKTIFAINAPTHFVDDLGHILSNQTNSFAIIWRENAGRVKVSLRSNGSVDVARIAEKFNGGGHKAASAFSFPAGEKNPWKLVKNAQKK